MSAKFNKIDLTKMTKNQSTGKLISDQFQQKVVIQVNDAIRPMKREKNIYFEAVEAKTFTDESWKNSLGGFDFYHLFSSHSGCGHIILGYGQDTISALANLHFGGEFHPSKKAKDFTTPIEKRLLHEIGENICTNFASNFQKGELWQNVLQSSHIEMIYKKIPCNKYYEGRFSFDPNLLLACLFTKQNPLG